MQRQQTPRPLRFALVAFFLVALAIATTPATFGKPRAIFTVNSLANNGVGTLRWALDQANADDGANLIDIVVAGTITLQKELPQVAGTEEDLVILGPPEGVTINGNGHPVFYVNHVGLTLERINIRNGNRPDEFGGAAIFNNHGSVNIIHSTIYENNVTAIYTDFGRINILDSTIYGNVASGQGGALFNDGGIVSISKSTLRNNTAGVGGSLNVPPGGGAIYQLDGTLNINSSTLNNNSANAGGAILIKGGAVNLTNMTFYSNTAASSVGGTGGAIYVVDGTVNIRNNTITGNSSGNGGGLYVNFGTVTLTNTIVANNTLVNCATSVSATITNGGSNLRWPLSDSSCPGSPGDPKFDPTGLRDNGGPTKTIGLQLTSAAIDAGNDAICSDPFAPPGYGAGGMDQRGVPRPQAYHCDIGAFEAKLYIFPLVFR